MIEFVRWIFLVPKTWVGLMDWIHVVDISCRIIVAGRNEISNDYLEGIGFTYCFIYDGSIRELSGVHTCRAVKINF